MSRETAVEIHITLDALKAPPNASIAERIRGLVGSAAAALHEAGFAVGEGTLAEGITKALADAKCARGVLGAYVGDHGTLAEATGRLVDLRFEAIAQRDEQVLIRGRAEAREAEALERVEDARKCTEEADRRTAAAEGRHADEVQRHARTRAVFASEVERTEELAADLATQRAEVARLSAQLDYASEQIQAGLRRGA